jgi:hypothetical protein
LVVHVRFAVAPGCVSRIGVIQRIQSVLCCGRKDRPD